MGPTPSDLRASADEVRRASSFVTLAFADVGPRSGGSTWRGPAADAFGEGFRWADRCVGDVAEGLRAIATRLETWADQLQAEAEAVARAAEREREEHRWRWEEERARHVAGLPPRTLFGWGAASSPSDRGDGVPRWSPDGPGGEGG